MRESSQEVPAAVDDREDRDTSLVKSVSDPVVAYDQFADGLVTVLRDYPAQPGMMSKTIDVADKAPGHSSRVCHRVLTDVRDDFSEIGSGTYRPADRSHLARLRLTSSWDTVLPLASSPRPRSTRWRKYSSYMMSSREASWGKYLIILRAVCLAVMRKPSKAADEALDALVVGLEGVLAEDGLALWIVELQVDPVHAVVLALEVGLADELAP